MAIERTHLFNMRISEDERAKLAALAEDDDMPSSVLVRRWIKQRYEAGSATRTEGRTRGGEQAMSAKKKPAPKRRATTREPISLTGRGRTRATTPPPCASGTRSWRR